MKKSIFSFALASVLLWSCNNQTKTPAETTNPKDTITEITEDVIPFNDGHNAQNSLDWEGVYKGTTPCADCSGIETEIELNNDLTYTVKMKYLGKAKEPIFEDKGTFTWDKDGSTILLSGNGTSTQKYFVGENTLTQLDINGSKIEGQLADLYILKK